MPEGPQVMTRQSQGPQKPENNDYVLEPLGCLRFSGNLKKNIVLIFEGPETLMKESQGPEGV